MPGHQPSFPALLCPTRLLLPSQQTARYMLGYSATLSGTGVFSFIQVSEEADEETTCNKCQGHDDETK